MRSLESRLAQIVGEEHVLCDPSLTAAYETDWTGRFQGQARCVVRPANASETSLVMAACCEVAVGVVPQGGNTGLVGGGVPRGGEVVLSMRRLDRIDDVDTSAASVTGGAGATLATIQAATRSEGLDVGIDLAARDSATIGGMVATNAGGIHVLRYGMMRDRLLGVEAVLGDGTVIGTRGMRKDNTGYDLAALLAGSEGTLGVITRAHIRLAPLLPHRTVVLVGLASPEALPAVVGALRRDAPSLHACEFLLASALEAVRSHRHLRPPLPNAYPVYVLVEGAATYEPLPELAAALAPLVDAEATAVADSASLRLELWEYREAATDAISSLGIPHKLDVTVPPRSLPDFLAAAPSVVDDAAPGARAIMFGHAADGNVHVNVLGPDPDDYRVDEAILRLVATSGGSISAEHGIGVAKAAYLPLARRPEEIAVMRRVRAALDPAKILNPGVLFTT